MFKTCWKCKRWCSQNEPLQHLQKGRENQVFFSKRLEKISPRPPTFGHLTYKTETNGGPMEILTRFHSPASHTPHKLTTEEAQLIAGLMQSPSGTPACLLVPPVRLNSLPCGQVHAILPARSMPLPFLVPCLVPSVPIGPSRNLPHSLRRVNMATDLVFWIYKSLIMCPAAQVQIAPER